MAYDWHTGQNAPDPLQPSLSGATAASVVGQPVDTSPAQLPNIPPIASPKAPPTPSLDGATLGSVQGSPVDTSPVQLPSSGMDRGAKLDRKTGQAAQVPPINPNAGSLLLDPSARSAVRSGINSIVNYNGIGQAPGNYDVSASPAPNRAMLPAHSRRGIAPIAQGASAPENPAHGTPEWTAWQNNRNAFAASDAGSTPQASADTPPIVPISTAPAPSAPAPTVAPIVYNGKVDLGDGRGLRGVSMQQDPGEADRMTRVRQEQGQRDTDLRNSQSQALRATALADYQAQKEQLKNDIQSLAYHTGARNAYDGQAQINAAHARIAGTQAQIAMSEKALGIEQKDQELGNTLAEKKYAVEAGINERKYTADSTLAGHKLSAEATVAAAKERASGYRDGQSIKAGAKDQAGKDSKDLVKTYYQTFKTLNLPAEYAGQHMELAKMKANADDPAVDRGIYYNPATPNRGGIYTQKSVYEPLLAKYTAAGYPIGDAHANAFKELQAIQKQTGTTLYQNFPNLDRLANNEHKPITGM